MNQLLDRLMAALLVLLACLVLMVWAGWLGERWQAVGSASWAAPSAEHWLGTNRLGQDILARVLVSLARAFEVGLIVGPLSVLIGGLLGALAGYFRGRWPDGLLLWLTGCLEAIPHYLLIGAVVLAFEGYHGALQLGMVLAFWPATARIVRSATLSLRPQPFIEAARVAGLGPMAIVWRHLLPHLQGLLLVQAALVAVAAIKSEVVLSFVGLGGHDSISFGLLLAEAAQDLLAGQYANLLAASALLFMLILAINHWADRLHSLSDPRRRLPRAVSEAARQTPV